MGETSIETSCQKRELFRYLRRGRDVGAVIATLFITFIMLAPGVMGSSNVYLVVNVDSELPWSHAFETLTGVTQVQVSLESFEEEISLLITFSGCAADSPLSLGSLEQGSIRAGYDNYFLLKVSSPNALKFYASNGMTIGIEAFQGNRMSIAEHSHVRGYLPATKIGNQLYLEFPEGGYDVEFEPVGRAELVAFTGGAISRYVSTDGPEDFDLPGGTGLMRIGGGEETLFNLQIDYTGGGTFVNEYHPAATQPVEETRTEPGPSTISFDLIPEADCNIYNGTEQGYLYQARTLNYSAHFGKEWSPGLVEIEKGDYRILFDPVDSNPCEVSAELNVLTLSNLYNGTIVEYIVLENRVKERIFIEEDIGVRSYRSQVYFEGLDYRFTEGGDIEFVSNDVIVYTIEKPFLEDASGETSHSCRLNLSSSTLDNSMYLDILLEDEGWLENASFPVVLDPSIVFVYDESLTTESYPWLSQLEIMDNGDLFVLAGVYQGGLYLYRSTDGGLTWGLAQTIESDGITTDEHDLTTDGTVLHIAYTKEMDVHYLRYDPGTGESFGPETVYEGEYLYHVSVMETPWTYDEFITEWWYGGSEPTIAVSSTDGDNVVLSHQESVMYRMTHKWRYYVPGWPLGKWISGISKWGSYEAISTVNATLDGGVSWISETLYNASGGVVNDTLLKAYGHSSSITERDGTFYLAYSGTFNGTTDELELLVATSQDGIGWSADPWLASEKGLDLDIAADNEGNILVAFRRLSGNPFVVHLYPPPVEVTKLDMYGNVISVDIFAPEQPKERFLNPNLCTYLDHYYLFYTNDYQWEVQCAFSMDRGQSWNDSTTGEQGGCGQLAGKVSDARLHYVYFDDAYIEGEYRPVLNYSSRGIPIPADAGPDGIAVMGEAIDFNTTSAYDPDGTYATYEWEFGDGELGIGAVLYHNYLVPGNYTVNLTVTHGDFAFTDSAFIEVLGLKEVQEYINGTIENLTVDDLACNPSSVQGKKDALLSVFDDMFEALGGNSSDATWEAWQTLVNAVEKIILKFMTPTEAREALWDFLNRTKAADFDSDGLTFEEEATVTGTNAIWWDTDGDGMSDGWEHFMGLDPSDAGDGGSSDSDGDGLTNYEEWLYQEYGASPTDPDVDDDLFEDGAEFDYWNDTFNLTLEEILNYTFLVPDVDDDALLDGDEVMRSTSLLLNDTDGDGLDDFDEAYQFHTVSRGDLNAAIDFTNGFSLPQLETVPLEYTVSVDLTREVCTANLRAYIVDEEYNYSANEYRLKIIGESITVWANESAVEELTNESLEELDDARFREAIQISGAEVEAYSSRETILNRSTGNSFIVKAKRYLIIYGLNVAELFDFTLGLVPVAGIDDIIFDMSYYVIEKQGLDPIDSDTDNDMLLDEYELEIGTDPLKKDTDGDGLWDGPDVLIASRTADELTLVALGTNGGVLPTVTFDPAYDPQIAENASFIYAGELSLGSDPTKSDFDQDGLDDYAERDLGTNTYELDSDGDRLLDGQDIEVTDDDPRYLTFARDVFFIQVDENTRRFLGESKPGSSPVTWDSEDDGMPDGWEVRYSLDPLFDDSLDDYDNPTSGDGLTNREEYLLGTDPTFWDSDDDGLSDGDEARVYVNTSSIDGNLTVNGPTTLYLGVFENVTVKEAYLSFNSTGGIMDPSLDVGGDGGVEWSYTGFFDFADVTLDLSGEMNDYLSTHLDADDGNVDGLISVPFVFDSSAEGVVNISGNVLLLDGIGSNPLVNDTDRDGVIDGQEWDWNLDTDNDTIANVLDTDSDGDYLTDGIEFVWGLQYYPSGLEGTAMITVDIDGDNITDGLEDINNNGLQDEWETSPIVNDSDGDGLLDGIEDRNHNGYREMDETDPLNNDTDGDGLPDGWIDGWVDGIPNGEKDDGEYEDYDQDGEIDYGETDPRDDDTDDDGDNDSADCHPCNPKPRASINGIPELDVNESFLFTANIIDNDPVSYYWDFGDGNTSDLESPSHAFALEGTYTVNFTVTDSVGQHCTTSYTMRVRRLWSALIEPDPWSGLYTPRNWTEGSLMTGIAHQDYYVSCYADLDDDTDLDLTLGDIYGGLHYYINQGSGTSPLWMEDPAMFAGIDAGWYAAPAFADLDNDGDNDMVLGDWNGTLVYYLNSGTTGLPAWVLDESMFQGIDVGYLSVPSFVDMDGDGDMDLVVGEFSGSLTYIENVGNATSPDWYMDEAFFSGVSVGGWSVPAFTDFDNDLDYDLILGSHFLWDTEYYEGEDIEFYTMPEAGLFDFECTWSFGDGDTSSDYQTTHNYSNNGVYLVQLTLEEGDASEVASCVITVLNVPPTCDAGLNQTVDEGTVVCFNGSIVDPGSGDEHTVEWDFGDGGSAFGTLAPSHKYVDNGTFTVTLSVTETVDGLSDNDTCVITVSNVAPTCQIDDRTVDEGEHFQLIATYYDPGDDELNFTWDFGDGSYGYGPTPIHMYPDEDVFEVSLTVNDGDGGVGWDTCVVTVLNAPPCNVTAWYVEQDYYEGDTVQFHGTFEDPGQQDTHVLTWDFDATFDSDNDTDPTNDVDGTGSDPTWTYHDDAEYVVKLTVDDQEGGVTSTTCTITVANVAPYNVDAGPDKSAPEGDLITLTGSYVDPGYDDFTIFWDMDSSVDADRDENYTNDRDVMGLQVEYAYPDDGVFTVTLNVLDGDGGIGLDDCQVVVSNVIPQDVDAGEDQNVNEGDLVEFTGTFTDPGTLDEHTYLWDFGDGVTSDEQNPTHAYGDNGMYTVCFTVYDDDGYATDTCTIYADNVAPTYWATPYLHIGIVKNDTFHFWGDYEDPGYLDEMNFTWRFGDGEQCYTQNASHIYSDDGEYIVEFEVHDDDGGVSPKDFCYVKVVKEDCRRSCYAGPDIYATVGEEVQFQCVYIDVGVNASFHWTFGDGGSSDEQNPQYAFDDTGDYTVKVAIEYEGIEVCTDTLKVEVAAPPLARLSPIDSSWDGLEAAQSTQSPEESLGLRYYKNVGGPRVPYWSYKDSLYSISDFESNVAPSFADLDGDGEADLCALEWDGSMAYYKDTRGYVFLDQRQFEGYPIVFENSFPLREGEFYWEFSDLTNSTEIEHEHRFPDNDAYVAKLTVYSEYGTSVDTCIIETINSPPVPVVTASTTMINECESVQFTGSLTDPGSADTHTWFWDFDYYHDAPDDGDPSTSWDGDGNPRNDNQSTSLTPEWMFTESGTYTVGFKVTDDDNAWQWSLITITVNNLAPTVTILTPVLVADEGQEVSFQGTFDDPGENENYVIWWDFGGMDTRLGLSVSYAFGNDDIFTVTLHVDDGEGGHGTASYDIEINNLPPYCDVGDDRIVVEGDPVTFDAFYSDPGELDILSFLWDFGDGSPTSTLESPTHTFDDGNYTVSLTVTDNAGASFTDTCNVTVLRAPPTCYMADLSALEGQQVTFDPGTTASGVDDVIAWEWDFDYDGIVFDVDAIVEHPIWIFANDGSYTVALRVYDEDGDMGEATCTVTVYNVAPKCIPGVLQTVFEGEMFYPIAMFTDDGVLDTHTAKWKLSPGAPWVDGEVTESVVDGVLQGIVTYPPGCKWMNEGSYGITFSVSDELSTRTGFCAIEVKNANPIVTGINVNAGPDGAYEVEPIIFSGTFIDPGVYDTHTAIWDFGDGCRISGSVNDVSGQEIGQTNAGHRYISDGTYTVKLTIRDDRCASHTFSVDVVVENLDPTLGAMTRGGGYEGANNEYMVQFTDIGKEWHKAMFDFGDGTPAKRGSISSIFIDTLIGAERVVYKTGYISCWHTYADDSSDRPDGTYSVTVTLSDQDGNFDEEVFEVTILNKNPILVDAGINRFIWEGEELTFVGKGYDVQGDPLTFTWDFDSSIDTNGNGIGDDDPDATGTSVSHVFVDDGVYTVTLTVRDDDGGASKDTLVVTSMDIANVAILSLSASGAGTMYQGRYLRATDSEQVTLTCTFSGNLFELTYNWDYDSNVDTSGDGIKDNDPDGTSATVNPIFLGGSGTKTVTLTLADDDGNWDKRTIDICSPDADGDEISNEDELLHGMDLFADDTMLDKDLDGLTNYFEYTHVYEGGLKTDMSNPDTDGDGLYDGWVDDGDGIFGTGDTAGEKQYTTNPTVYDHDGDGISDGQEVNGYKVTYTTVEADGSISSHSRIIHSPPKTPNMMYDNQGNPVPLDSDLDGMTDEFEIDMRDNPNTNNSNTDVNERDFYNPFVVDNAPPQIKNVVPHKPTLVNDAGQITAVYWATIEFDVYEPSGLQFCFVTMTKTGDWEALEIGENRKELQHFKAVLDTGDTILTGAWKYNARIEAMDDNLNYINMEAEWEITLVKFWNALTGVLADTWQAAVEAASWLVDILIEQAKEKIGEALNGVKQAIEGYVDGIISTLEEIFTENSLSLAESDPIEAVNKFLEKLFTGPVFYGLMALGLAIPAISLILSGITLGAGTIIGGALSFIVPYILMQLLDSPHSSERRNASDDPSMELGFKSLLGLVLPNDIIEQSGKVVSIISFGVAAFKIIKEIAGVAKTTGLARHIWKLIRIISKTDALGLIIAGIGVVISVYSSDTLLGAWGGLICALFGWLLTIFTHAPDDGIGTISWIEEALGGVGTAISGYLLYNYYYGGE